MIPALLLHSAPGMAVCCFVSPSILAGHSIGPHAPRVIRCWGSDVSQNTFPIIQVDRLARHFMLRSQASYASYIPTQVATSIGRSPGFARLSDSVNTAELPKTRDQGIYCYSPSVSPLHAVILLPNQAIPMASMCYPRAASPNMTPRVARPK
jgi:hypothetical protein